MNAQRLELALRKQRLQLRSAQLRADIAADAAAFEPLFAAGDKVRDGARWLKHHPEVAVGTGVALLVARPRALMRWARRGLFAWQAVRRARLWLEQRSAP